LSLRLAINIIKKDWFEYQKTILLLTAALFVPLIYNRGNTTDFSKGMMAGTLVGAAYLSWNLRIKSRESHDLGGLSFL
jgi:hypothetical protein